MRTTTILRLVALAVGALIWPSASRAQSCTPVDSLLLPALESIKRLVVSTNPIKVQKRQRHAIPAVDSSTVTVVSVMKVCDKVLASFKPTLPAAAPAPTRLFVMKVGTTYVVLYPMVGDEKVDFYRVMSRQYAVLSRFSL